MVTVYAIVYNGRWKFENNEDVITKISGSGAIPTLITLTKCSKGEKVGYIFAGDNGNTYEVTMDG